MLLDTQTAIRTPERVQFRHHIAGPGPRALAWLADQVLQFSVLALIIMVVGIVGAGARLEGLSTGATMILVFLSQWFYAAAWEIALQGRTPGKMAVGLRVVSDGGSPANATQFVLRNLLRGVDFLPSFYGFGLMAMGSDPMLRRIGDRVAGTFVVVERRAVMLESVDLPEPVTEEERRSLPARVAMTRQEIQTVENFLRRRDRLSTPRANELTEGLANQLRDLGVEAESHERVVMLAYARATGRDRSLGAE